MTDRPYLRLHSLEHDEIFPKCKYQRPGAHYPETSSFALQVTPYFASNWSRDLPRDQIFYFLKLAICRWILFVQKNKFAFSNERKASLRNGNGYDYDYGNKYVTKQ